MYQVPKHASCLTQYGRVAVVVVPEGLAISIRTPSNLLSKPDKSDRFVQNISFKQPQKLLPMVFRISPTSLN